MAIQIPLDSIATLSPHGCLLDPNRAITGGPVRPSSGGLAALPQEIVVLPVLPTLGCASADRRSTLPTPRGNPRPPGVPNYSCFFSGSDFNGISGPRSGSPDFFSVRSTT